MANWYYQTMGEVVGPLTPLQLRNSAALGRIVPETLVRSGDAGAWTAASNVKGLLDASGNAVPAPGKGQAVEHRPPARVPVRVPATVAAPQASAIEPARRNRVVVVATIAATGCALAAVVAVLLLRSTAEQSRDTERLQVEAREAAARDAERLQAARIRQENAELKARLARLEAAVGQRKQPEAIASAVPNSPASDASSAPHFETPEAVVRAYLNAATWQDRIPFVAQPDVVQSAMREAYERMTPAGAVATQMRPSVWSKAKFLPPRKEPDGKIHVPVDMTGLDEDNLWEYIVVTTPEGFKVDWLASQEIHSKRKVQRRLEKWNIKDAQIEVEVLAIRQSEGSSYTHMPIKVTNKSGAHIKWWTIGVSVSDAHGKFLATDAAHGQNLRPGESSYSEEFSFANVRYSTFGFWEMRLENLLLDNEQGEELAGAERHFELVGGKGDILLLKPSKDGWVPK